MAIWRVELFGGLRLTQGERTLTRLETGKVTALFARLALFPRVHPREELAEYLWPDIDPVVGRNRLRNALSVLRSQLEAPGTPPGTVLVADALGVSLRPGSVEVDVRVWERLHRSKHFEEAEALWKGELLPGFYDEWIVVERDRLNALRENSSIALISVAAPPTLPELPEPLVALPSYPTRYFGREAESDLLDGLLASARLVTLTGPGGVGKTRLSVETALRLADRFPGGAVFVPLAQRWSADGLLETIRAALQLPSGRSPLDALRRHTESSPALVLLDNFEQLVSVGGAELVETLLAHAPGMTLLISSRRVLGLDGEHEVPLAPLTIPAGLVPWEQAAQIPGVALFIDRAQSVRPRFALSDGNLDAVLALCRRLEGLPIALELAAARIRGYTLAQMEAALNDRFALLIRPGGGSRKEMRHASLRATIEWSWQLLSPASQRLFARFSVFRGGATARAVREVCDEPDAQTLLEGLVADSLMVATGDDGGEMRFSLLESLRDFADERLDETNHADSQRRHADYFLTLASYVRGLVPDSLAALDGEFENIQIALERGAETRREVFWTGLRGVLVYAFSRGLHRQVRSWVERLSNRSLTVPETLVGYQVQNMAARILVDTGQFEEGRRLARDIRFLAERTQHEEQALYATTLLGYIASEIGEHESAVTIQREALAQARLLPDPALRRYCEFDTARALLVFALDPGRQKELQIELLQEAESLLRALVAWPTNAALVHLGLAIALLYQGRLEEAYPLLKAAQGLAWRAQETSVLLYCLVYESHYSLLIGNMERAALLLGAFDRLQEQIDYVASNSPAESDAEILRQRLGSEAFESLVLRGSQTPVEELLETDGVASQS